MDGRCPMAQKSKDADEINSANNMPASASMGQQWVHEEQRRGLPTQRAVSNIPRPADSAPSHQPTTDEDKWVYPSPQMFWNAMKRKGYDPKEHDMHSVVAIHNSVNEKTWEQVMTWESTHASLHNTSPSVQLARFLGRPTDFSPRARMYQLLGYSLPFDRHDWFIRRGEAGEEVRYVVDFYRGQSEDPTKAGFYIDVRPALDSWDAVKLRAAMWWREMWDQ